MTAEVALLGEFVRPRSELAELVDIDELALGPIGRADHDVMPAQP
jgi:hypothetical protein